MSKFQPKDSSKDGHKKDQNASHQRTHGIQRRQMNRQLGRSMQRFGSLPNNTLASGVDKTFQAKKENSSQDDFSELKVTKDDEDFTQNNKIHFKPGNYKPHSTEDQENYESHTTTENEIAQESIISEDGGLITVTLYDGAGIAYEKELNRDIEGIRDYIISNYNWNAIVKIMKFGSSKVGDFEYSSPTNLKGTTADNSIIIPKQGVLAIISAQLQDAIAQNGAEITSDNIASILAMIDGLPGAGFAAIMGEDSQNTLRDEEGNNSMQREDGTEIEIPDFSSDNEETPYDFMRDITLARNGLWSDEDSIVNLTGLRRELEITEDTDHLVQWNDTMAACWIEEDDDCNKVKRCKHYIATTEPGNRDANRMMRPQTVTTLLGLHKGRQPGGRTKNILAQENDMGNNELSFRTDRGMNLHPGGIIGNQRGGMGVSSQAISSLPGGQGAVNDSEFGSQILLAEAFCILSKYGKDRNKSAYFYLKLVAEEAEEIQSLKNSLTQAQQQSLIDYERLENIFSEDIFSIDIENYLKNTLEFDIENESNILQSTTTEGYTQTNLADGALEISGTLKGARVAGSSEGCQVIFGGKTFYEYWWNTINKAENSGQRRWYFTLVNLTNSYNDIETSNGEF